MSDTNAILLLILAVLLFGAGPVGIFIGVVLGLFLLLWLFDKWASRRYQKRKQREAEAKRAADPSMT